MITKKVFISGLAIASLALSGCGGLQDMVNNKIATTTTPVAQITTAADTPVVIYTEKMKEVTDKNRSWPTVKIWEKIGDQQPVLLADNIGKVGEYLNSVRFTPDHKALIIYLESKLQIIDLETKTLKDLFIPKKQVESFIFSRDHKKIFIWDQIYASSNDYEYYVESLDLATGAVNVMKHGDTGGKYFFLGAEREDGILTLNQAMGEASAPWFFNPKTAELKPIPGYSAALYSVSAHAGKYISSVKKSVVNACNDFSGDEVSIISIVDSVSGKTIDTIGIKDNGTGGMTFSPDDTKVLFESHAPLKAISGQSYEDTQKWCNTVKPQKNWYIKTIGGSAATALSEGDAEALLKSWNPADMADFDAKYTTVGDSESVLVLLYKGKEIFRSTNMKINIIGYFLIIQNYSDLAACGNFPTSTGDGGPTSRYSVCRNSNDGQCYYKKAYSEQIKGCDPQFDKNPYGNPECFESKTALFTPAGSPSPSSAASANDSCALTTQDFFKSKVSE